MKGKDFGFLFWLHFGLIVTAYASPFWLDWKIVASAVFVLQLYYLARGGCDLTFMEFGNDRDTTFLWYYLHKIFPSLDQKKTKFVVRIIVPLIIVLSAGISQILVGYQPYFSF